MSERKDVDRLFQEKFKDFEAAPPEFVWENIKDALQEKKKRRIIPLWIKLSGVAAILVIGSLFTLPYFRGIDTNENPVVLDKNGQKRIYPTDKPVPNHGTIVGDNENGTSNGTTNEAVASGNDNATGKGANGATMQDDANKGNTQVGKDIIENNNAVAHDHNAPDAEKNGKGGTNNKKSRRNKLTHTNEGVAYGGAGNKSGKGTGNRNASGTVVNDKTDPSPKGIRAVQGLPGSSQNVVAQGSDKKTQQQSDSEGSATASGGNATQNGIIKRELPVENAIAEAAAVDTVLKPENELDKILKDNLAKKNEDKAVAELGNKGKWNIKPQVAPVFYNSLSEGSPIDGQFSGNSKSFDNDMSYGVGIDYAITDRLSVRSGVNTVNLSYATNDIQFSPSLSNQTNNVSRRAKAANIVVSNAGNDTGSNPQPSTLSFPAQQFNGSMVQQTGYIEVPVEMSYALVNRKFGIDVIGGVSTLFLNENNVSVVSTQGYSTEVGEAQNLNNIHFSTNIGLGFRYRFWKSFQANFEPTFKYQVNAYSRDAGNFKPYFIGLYSGISFIF